MSGNGITRLPSTRRANRAILRAHTTGTCFLCGSKGNISHSPTAGRPWTGVLSARSDGCRSRGTRHFHRGDRNVKSSVFAGAAFGMAIVLGGPAHAQDAQNVPGAQDADSSGAETVAEVIVTG